MTYFQVLATFILPPLLILMIVVPQDIWRRLFKRQGQVDWLPYIGVLLHVVIAVIYTTPWDNYLVATNVWWYDPQLVTGIRLGYVPIEEYTFFVLQTLLTGFWTLFLMRYVFKAPLREERNYSLRIAAGSLSVVLWLASTVLLLSGWRPGTYGTLILSWALVPVLLQTIFGADILLWHWRSLLLIVLPPTLYLWLLDAVALSGGTWTIDPAQTTGWMVGVIPIEEMLFFFITNLIIGFGMTLLYSPASKERAAKWIKSLRSKRAGLSPSKG